jgi:hypothetical protein
MIDHRFLHDATLMKVNVLLAHFIAESWHHVTHNNCELFSEMRIQFKSI